MNRREFFPIAGLAGLAFAGPAQAQLGAVPTIPVPWTYTHSSVTGTLAVKAAGGTFHGIAINAVGVAAAPTMTIFDGSTTTGTIVAALSSPTVGIYLYDVAFLTSLNIVTTTASNASDITVMWK